LIVVCVNIHGFRMGSLNLAQHSGNNVCLHFASRLSEN
jgi:hypothetical protein